MEKACEQKRFTNKLDGKPDMVCISPCSLRLVMALLSNLCNCSLAQQLL